MTPRAQGKKPQKTKSRSDLEKDFKRKRHAKILSAIKQVRAAEKMDVQVCCMFLDHETSQATAYYSGAADSLIPFKDMVEGRTQGFAPTMLTPKDFMTAQEAENQARAQRRKGTDGQGISTGSMSPATSFEPLLPTPEPPRALLRERRDVAPVGDLRHVTMADIEGGEAIPTPRPPWNAGLDMTDMTTNHARGLGVDDFTFPLGDPHTTLNGVGTTGPIDIFQHPFGDRDAGRPSNTGDLPSDGMDFSQLLSLDPTNTYDLQGLGMSESVFPPMELDDAMKSSSAETSGAFDFSTSHSTMNFSAGDDVGSLLSSHDAPSQSDHSDHWLSAYEPTRGRVGVDHSVSADAVNSRDDECRSLLGQGQVVEESRVAQADSAGGERGSGPATGQVEQDLVDPSPQARDQGPQDI